MKCPKCQGTTRVLDVRHQDGTVLRRRACIGCPHIYTTREAVDATADEPMRAMMNKTTAAWRARKKDTEAA